MEIEKTCSNCIHQTKDRMSEICNKCYNYERWELIKDEEIEGRFRSPFLLPTHIPLPDITHPISLDKLNIIYYIKKKKFKKKRKLIKLNQNN